MKREVKKIDSTAREINIEISGDAVKNKFEEIFARIAKEAKVAGFRPGHAPRNIIEKHYSSHAHEQVLKELVPDVYSRAIQEEKLDVIEMPEISEVRLDRSRLSFKAVVSVSPEVAIKNYKGIKIDYQKVSVSPEELKRNMESLKESRKVAALDDNFARSLCYSALSDLEKAIERQIFTQKENSLRQNVENQIIESLLKQVNFNLPQSMVKRQLQELVRQAKLDLALKGAPREKLDEQEKEISKELEPEAKRQVKIYLILSEIAKKENIPLDDNMPRKVMEFLLREADWKETSSII
ncbi:MAG: trigger factor [Candidatus Omnitrophota bacterium]|nr:trigger factor [Candidatus Omnitrophota bacterium]